MHQIIYKKQSLKVLDKMPKPLAARFRSAFNAIAQGEHRYLDIKPMAGVGGFRLRIGDYRAVYEIDNGRLIVTVFNINSRGDIYK